MGYVNPVSGTVFCFITGNVESPVVDDSRQTTSLEESIRVYTEAIAGLERARQRMLRQRRVAADSVKERINESLALNQRTLKSLRKFHAAAEAEFAREKLRDNKRPE